VLANSDQIVAATNEILDSTSQAISSDAFRRQGKIITVEEKRLRFNINIKTIDTERRHIGTPASECQICNGTYPEKFEDIVLQAPFDMTNSYARLQEATHGKSLCMNCESTGKVMCNNCRGNNNLACPECDSTGRIIRAEDCPSCDGSSLSGSECPDCQNDDTATIIECPNCNGKGNLVCTDCDGEGDVNCSECMGAGNLHTYYKLEYKVKRDVKVDELPAFWEGSAVEIATQIDWDREDLQVLTSSSRAVEIETVDHRVGFVSLEYLGDRYNAVLFLDESNLDGIWDPETGHPETSVRRKLTDLKSRIVGNLS